MISLEKVSKKFGTGVFGLSDITFSVEKGEFVFLVGPTGSGKTTIFKLLIRDTLPTSGTIVVSGWDILKLPGKKVPELRKKIGVIFQDLKLLNDRTILENTTLPLEVAGVKTKEAISKGEEVLKSVGILEHKDKFPVQLSGGELQRAAIARALIMSPEILLADEPTGNLDEETAFGIVKLLSDINELGTTVLMATHSKEIIKKLNRRVIELEKGELTNDKGSHKPKEEKKHEEASHAQNPEPEKDEKEAEPEKHEEEKPKEKKDDKLKTDDFEDALK
jgi:cell division transport system ATP-binding protein